MYALVGRFVEVFQPKIGESFVREEMDRTVALFSSWEKAAEYRRRALLAKTQRQTFGPDKVFRQNSLLANCEEAYIEVYEEPDYPVDPEI